MVLDIPPTARERSLKDMLPSTRRCQMIGIIHLEERMFMAYTIGHSLSGSRDAAIALAWLLSM